jgi:hypothetical protein
MVERYCNLKDQNAAAAAALGAKPETRLERGIFSAKSADGTTTLSANGQTVTVVNRQPNGAVGTAELANGQLRPAIQTDSMSVMSAQDGAASAAQVFRAKLPGGCTSGGPT